MPTETERKYLVRVDDPRWRVLVRATHTLRQGYLCADPEREVRVRVVSGTAAFLTVKGRRTGPVRPEYEYPVPVADALELLALCGGRVLEKRRHSLPDGWVVDEYTGAHSGLAVAEVEWTGDPDTPPPAPPWAGRDITGDRAYSNAGLAAGPAGD
ncbi:CYTH domain-containing protein [Streptomyces sp. NPDC059506]|uniref:CYTH domain-containing protein n=1 Tax=Streptomyces TaxID=1883 RepID=UPI000CAD635F|nr:MULTISPECIES: CYTH domain-containing protein [unclassified Streptomyces]MCZ2526766.1 CYTH domain-containing protein [Streptomyces sp. HB2AG]PLW71944.1 adenylate cyclase [Streptomyces sp. DJ]QMV23157.1 CYTH domain-containing protein [Streptomyces sp. SCUT-3]